MMSNSKFTTAYLAAIFGVFLLFVLAPGDAAPTWLQLLIGVIFGLSARKALLARLNAQSEQRV